jgi:hypothetical protein
MKIACISYFIPGKENNQGPNSLIYQLIKKRNKEILIDMYLPEKIFNACKYKTADIERDLDINIHPLYNCKHGFLKNLYSFWWPSGARIYPKIDGNLLKKYDLVWCYPNWVAPHLGKIHTKFIISGMDSLTLLYYRKLKSCIEDRSLKFVKYFFALLRAFFFESAFLKDKKVHVVGRADDRILKRINVKSFYIPHPINPIVKKDAFLKRPRSKNSIRILVSNALDPFYGSETVLKWLRKLFDTIYKIPNQEFEIIFHKGDHKKVANCLKKENLPRYIKVTYINWVDNYEEFLAGIDIQIFPLDIGAGTKTSVLTALYMNVVCIGTTIACENIETQSLPDSLLVANSSTEFAQKFEVAVSNLDKLANQPLGYLIAAEHNPSQSVENFWNKVLQNND